MPVAVGQIRRVLFDQLPDLFVNSNRLQREALGRVVLSDAIVGRDGFGVGREAGLQITDLQKRAGIVRIVLDDPLVLRDCPVVPLFLDVLLGSLKRVLAIGLLHVRFSQSSKSVARSWRWPMPLRGPKS